MQIREIRGHFIQGGIQMLGKLIKYDLKYAAKIFFLLHVIYLLICLVARFFYMDRLRFEEPVEPLVFSLILFVTLMTLLISALSIFTWMQVAFRFYRNLFSKEGYLSWTLPVSAPQHLWSKIISGYILMAADLLILSAGVLLLVTGDNVTSAYSMIADELENELGFSLGSFVCLLFITCLINCLCTVIMLYFSILVGQLFPSHRVLGAIAAYFITSFVVQILTMLLMLVFGFFPGYRGYSSAYGLDYTIRLLYMSLILMLIVTAIQYIAAHYIIKRKINLI